MSWSELIHWLRYPKYLESYRGYNTHQLNQFGDVEVRWEIEGRTICTRPFEGLLAARAYIDERYLALHNLLEGNDD